MEDRIQKDVIPFTQVSNELLNDKEISLKAKGIYSFMFSKPDNWNFTIKSMAKQLMEGTRSISAALNELKDKGWVSYIKNNDGTGKYILHLIPNLQNEVLEEPNLQNPNLHNSNMAKRIPINNKDIINNKDLSNGELSLNFFKNEDKINSGAKKTDIDFDKLLKYLNEKTGKRMRVVSTSVKNSFKARLKDGYTKNDIVNAIDNAVKSEYHKENNFQYLTIEFFSRSATIDKYGFISSKQTNNESKKVSTDKIPIG